MGARLIDITTGEPPDWASEQIPDEYAMHAGIVEADEAAAAPQPSRFAILTVAELMAQPPTRWTVRDLIPQSGLGVVYGGPGSGKTFLMLDMAAHIARGKPWQGRRTRAGVVVYIAAEGALGVRLNAYMQHHELTTPDLANLLVLQSGINLLDPAADVLDLIAAIKAAVGDREIRMIVVDTLARSMPGGNENASEDMGAVINSAGKLQDAFQCVLCFVHHCGKDETKGSRGHSSLKGATDVEISVRRDGQVRTAVAEKVRDGTDQSVLVTFKLESVDLGPLHEIDPDADVTERISSCVLVPTDAVEKAPKLTGEVQREIVSILRISPDFRMRADDVRDALKKSGRDRSSARKALKTLEEVGATSFVSGWLTLLEKYRT